MTTLRELLGARVRRSGSRCHLCLFYCACFDVWCEPGVSYPGSNEAWPCHEGTFRDHVTDYEERSLLHAEGEVGGRFQSWGWPWGWR